MALLASGLFLTKHRNKIQNQLQPFLGDFRTAEVLAEITNRTRN